MSVLSAPISSAVSLNSKKRRCNTRWYYVDTRERMSPEQLLLPLEHLELEAVEPAGTTITIVPSSNRPGAVCPSCHTASACILSGVADLPWNEDLTIFAESIALVAFYFDLPHDRVEGETLNVRHENATGDARRAALAGFLTEIIAIRGAADELVIRLRDALLDM